MDRSSLHDLVERLPDAELSAARKYLEYLASNPAHRAAVAAAPDDEPVTEEDAASIRRAIEDLERGRTVSHEEVLGEFGLR